MSPSAPAAGTYSAGETPVAGGLPRGVLVVVGVLFAATAFALVANQRLKQAPALVRGVGVSPAFSPDGDGIRDEARISVTPGRRDRITATIVDERGRAVRVLRSERRRAARRRVRFRWDGRAADGRPAPAGTYRVRLALRRRGRTVELRKPIRLERPGGPAAAPPGPA